MSHASRLGAIASISGLLAMAIMVVVAGALTPGYSHVSQFISELGARGAVNEMGVRFAGFLLSGILLVVFCLAAYLELPRSRTATWGLVGLAVFAAGYLVAAGFPCDPGCRSVTPSKAQLIHNVGGLLGYVLAPAFLLALARASRGWPAAGHLATTGYVAAAIALAGLLTLSPTSPTVGLSQRALEFSVLAWAALCGGYLGTNRASRTHTPPRA